MRRELGIGANPFVGHWNLTETVFVEIFTQNLEHYLICVL
jgi:hypothetical protein